jgi:hypothetical protein
MSALLPIATAKADSRKIHVRFTPESGHVQCNSACLLWAISGLMQRSKGSLFDHLVGASKHGRGHGKANRFGGLEVDDQLVFGRRLHRHVSGLLAFENAIDLAGRAPRLVGHIDQTAVSNEGALEVDRGHLVAGRKRNNQIAMNECDRAPSYDQAAVVRTREGCDAALDFAGVLRADRTHLQPERRCRGLDRAPLANPGGYCGITKDRRSLHLRCDLLEQLQPFRAQIVIEQ